jgi:hypothetical protein
MVLDTTDLVLGALCLFPLAVTVHGLFWALVPGGVKFRPGPLTSQRGVFLVLAGIGLVLAVVAASPGFLAFVGVATVTVAVQHLAPKAWVAGRVAGVGFRPLAVDSIEREGRRVVLVLERGYRLVVPDTPDNQKFLTGLQEWDDER